MSLETPLTHLIFDLDDTLYAPNLGVVQRVNARIDLFIREHLGLVGPDVDTLRERYRLDHGTTLHGLMLHHSIEPDFYLAEVHAIELDDVLAPDPALRTMLARLPYENVVFTNGSASHAERVLHRLTIRECFGAIFSLDRVGYVPKPRPEAFQTVLGALDIDAKHCMFIDDYPQNLDTARALGMRTVLVRPATGDGRSHDDPGGHRDAHRDGYRHDHPHDHPTIASIHQIADLLADPLAS